MPIQELAEVLHEREESRVDVSACLALYNLNLSEATRMLRIFKNSLEQFPSRDANESMKAFILDKVLKSFFILQFNILFHPLTFSELREDINCALNLNELHLIVMSNSVV